MGIAIVLVVFLLVMGSCLAFVGMQGTWGAALTFVNTLLAAILATNYWEPMADWMQTMMPTFTYLIDFLAIWLVFCLFMLPLRVATDFISRVKLRFIKPVDMAGGYFFGFLTGWLMICFIMFSLHMAPLSRNFLGYWQPKPETRMVLVAPDRRWLAFFQKISAGPLAKGAPSENPKKYVFDPGGEFVIKYGTRRTNFEKEPALRVRIDEE